MGLKEELAKLEEEEQLTEVEDRLNGIQESIYGLYRRIGVIVEYIDNQEVTTIEEQQLRADEAEYREKAWELKALELAQKNKDLTKLLKEQENSYVKGYEDGVKAILEKDDTDKFPNEDVIEVIQKALCIKVPPDLASLILKTQVQSEKNNPKNQENPKR